MKKTYNKRVIILIAIANALLITAEKENKKNV